MNFAEFCFVIITAPIGAWKSNFQSFKKFITDQQTDMKDNREVTLRMIVNYTNTKNLLY